MSMIMIMMLRSVSSSRVVSSGWSLGGDSDYDNNCDNDRDVAVSSIHVARSGWSR